MGILHNVIAQSDPYIDSLWKCLKKKDDTLKLQAISNLAWEYNSIDIDRAIGLNHKGLRIAKQLKLPKYQAYSMMDLGASFYQKKYFDSSEFYFKAAEKILYPLNNFNDLGSLYNNMAALYNQMSEHNTSLSYSFKSLELNKKNGNKEDVALLLNNIGVTYEFLKNYKKAEEYYRKAIEVNGQIANKSGLARNYLGLGNVAISTKNSDNALVLYQKAERIFRELKSRNELAMTLNNIADVLDDKKSYAKAFEARNEALRIAEETENKVLEARFCFYNAQTLMLMNDFGRAATFVKRGEVLANELNTNEIELELRNAKAKYYFGTNQFELGTSYLEQYEHLKDSVFNADLSENIAALEVKSNVQQLRLEKAESDSLRLKSEQKVQRRNLLIIVIVACLLLAILFYYYFSKNQKIKTDLRYQSKVNSAVLESEMQTRFKIARDLHDSVGQQIAVLKMHAAQFENSLTDQLIDQLNKDIRSISHELVPEAFDFGLKSAISELKDRIEKSTPMQLNWQISEEVNTLSTSKQLAIFRILQELTANSLKYAEATKIEMQLNLQNSDFHFMFSDNGKGFDVEIVKKSVGLGWKNIEARVTLLEGIQQVNSEIGKGFTYRLQFPND